MVLLKISARKFPVTAHGGILRLFNSLGKSC